MFLCKGNRTCVLAGCAHTKPDKQMKENHSLSACNTELVLSSQNGHGENIYQ